MNINETDFNRIFNEDKPAKRKTVLEPSRDDKPRAGTSVEKINVDPPAKTKTG